jgi:hypothetical protein
LQGKLQFEWSSHSLCHHQSILSYVILSVLLHSFFLSHQFTFLSFSSSHHSRVRVTTAGEIYLLLEHGIFSFFWNFVTISNEHMDLIRIGRDKSILFGTEADQAPRISGVGLNLWFFAIDL